MTSTPTAPTTTSPDDEPRQRACRHLESVRRLKRHVAAFVVGMLVLTPVWALTQWQTSGGFERWSKDHSQPGDWEPWILWVALVWASILVVAALRVCLDGRRRNAGAGSGA